MTELQQLRMAAKAIIDDYPMTIAQRRDMVKSLSEALKTAIKPRDIATINKALLAIERTRLQAIQTVAALEPEADDDGVDYDALEEQRKTLRNDPEFVEFMRWKAAKALQ